jgi:hypothetical protein
MAIPVGKGWMSQRVGEKAFQVGRVSLRLLTGSPCGYLPTTMGILLRIPGMLWITQSSGIPAGRVVLGRE